jgi:hypothetical protein
LNRCLSHLNPEVLIIMHFRRLACFLLGSWLTGGLFMATVATQNFRSVDRLLAKPAAPARQQVDTLGRDSARMLLRYQVAEQNRLYFETWGLVETVIGFMLLMVLLFGSAETNFTLLLALLMLLIAVVQRFVLTPEIVILGRVIDFVPATQPSPERSHFWVLHAAYSSIEVLKWGLGVALTARLLFRRRRRPEGPEA